jgi:3-hydroxybutyryl-CoA dehydrogenase
MLEKLGVVGAGQMGNGIAHVASLAGMHVKLLDVKPELISKALATVGKNMDRQVSKGAISAEEKAGAISRIEAAETYDALAGCDIVIEAATEKEEVKKAIFRNLITHVGPDCIIATNTSSISVTRLGASTDRAGKFIGMHFFNPVPVMKLVEIIRGIATDDATYEAVADLARRMGKTTALAEDFPGFMANRILMPMINEAVYTLYEGVGTIEAIDCTMRLGCNHPMGPLELADFIGLDTCLSIMQVLLDGLSDTKYRPCPLLVKYVEAGWLGRKSGRGFYDYSVTPPRPTR